MFLAPRRILSRPSGPGGEGGPGPAVGWPRGQGEAPAHFPEILGREPPTDRYALSPARQLCPCQRFSDRMSPPLHPLGHWRV